MLQHGIGAPSCSPFLPNYLCRRVLADRTNDFNLPAAIHRIVDTLCAEIGAELKHLRRKYTQKWCDAAAENFWSLGAIEHLKAGAKREEVTTLMHQDYDQPPGNAIYHSLVAAAYLGLTSSFRCLLAKHTAANANSFYFGSALICAAGQGHIAITHELLDCGIDSWAPYLKGAFADAAKAGHLAILSILTEHRKDTPFDTVIFEDAIAHAAYGGHLDVINFLKGFIIPNRQLESRILRYAASGG